MPFKIRISKFRHVFGSPFRDHECYRNISITRNAHDGNFCAVNSKFLAIVTETSGGGSFLVLLLSEVGRVDIDHPRITGHRGPVVDLKFNPFNENEIASCSDDGTIKIWSIPDEGLKLDSSQWKVDLHGHQRRVDYIEWHPTAQNLLLSAGLDHQVILWNVERAEPIQIYRYHSDAIQSITWNRMGTVFATSCKDKHLRVIEARSGRLITEGLGHPGPKTSKVVFLGDTNCLLSTGYGKQFERQMAIWNASDLSKPLAVETIDFSAGALIPFYDHDTRIVYLAGKGDGNIRYYEYTENTEPYLHFLSEYKSSIPQRCLGMMPKISLDVKRNEIMRFYKLYAAGSICEPISMIVPRKSETFQVDIYPDTPGPYPALTPDEWMSGIDRDPILVSMKDRVAGTNISNITTYQTVDHSCVLSSRLPLQRPIQLPIAEVAPLLKSNSNNQSSEKGSDDLETSSQSGKYSQVLRKIESIKIPPNPRDFNQISKEKISPRSTLKPTINITPIMCDMSDIMLNQARDEFDQFSKFHSISTGLIHTQSASELFSTIKKGKLGSVAHTSSIESLPTITTMIVSPCKYLTSSRINSKIVEKSRTDGKTKFISSASIPLSQKYARKGLFNYLSNRAANRDKFQNARPPIGITRNHFEIKKNVWSIDTNQKFQHSSNGNEFLTCLSETNGTDYYQDYLKQQGELQSLRELLVSKEDRIRLLEDELNYLKQQLGNLELKSS